MRLDWLELTDFRSYGHLTFRPDAAVNVLVGPNATGKTNLLEAVSYLASLRSFRSAPDEALIASGTDHAIIRGEVSHRDSASLVEIELPVQGRRRVQVNRQRLARSTDLLGHLRLIVFLPDDLDIVKRSPSYRRDFVDGLAVQLWPGSYLDQSDYERALRQRNTLLRQMGRDTDPVTLAVWNERLSAAGGRVMARRARALEALREPLVDVYRGVSGRDDEIGMSYLSAWGGELDASVNESDWVVLLRSALERAERDDQDRRTTTVGLHRDEPTFTITGRPARFLASQGEQRSLVLALRLASHRAVSEAAGLSPLLVLDDVFSELDLDRAAALARALPDSQTFITTARDEEVPLAGRRWSVELGAVS